MPKPSAVSYQDYFEACSFLEFAAFGPDASQPVMPCLPETNLLSCDDAGAAATGTVGTSSGGAGSGNSLHPTLLDEAVLGGGASGTLYKARKTREYAGKRFFAAGTDGKTALDWARQEKRASDVALLEEAEASAERRQSRRTSSEQGAAARVSRRCSSLTPLSFLGLLLGAGCRGQGARHD